MSPPVPYRTTIRHARSEGARHAFRHRHTMWLVDLDDVPRTPRAAGRWWPQFAARDHLGDPDCTLRVNVDRFLAEHGIDLEGGRVLMLANPRVLGYVFNPISIHWCWGGNGRLRAVVAEVHNTFGGRHCYLLRPDDDGRTETEKRLYVSPFFGVDGTYEMRVPPPGDDVDVSITLRRGTRPAFVATLRGRRGRAPRSFAGAAMARPWATLRVITLIHWQALRLWWKGLRVTPRPAAPVREPVS